MTHIMGPDKGRKAIRFATTVPMRYVIKSEDMKTPDVKKGTIFDMSSVGVSFETEEKLSEGTIIVAEIMLRQRVVVEATGKVARVRPFESGEGRFYKVAIAFTEISNTAREEINMWYYSQRLSRESGTADAHEAEGKENEHFTAGRTFVEYREIRARGKKPWEEAEIKQVSRYGLSIIIAGAVAKEGEAWEIMIHLPAHREPIKTVARVVTAKTEGDTSEVALEFTKIEESDIKRLSQSGYMKR